MARQPRTGERAVVKNAASRKQIDYAERLREELERLEGDDLSFLLSTPQGRRVGYRLLAFTGMFQSDFDRDSHVMAHLTGRSAIGHELSRRMKLAAPDLYNLMATEQVLLSEREDRATEAQTTKRASEQLDANEDDPDS